jgi:hypothetical protein
MPVAAAPRTEQQASATDAISAPVRQRKMPAEKMRGSLLPQGFNNNRESSVIFMQISKRDDAHPPPPNQEIATA